MKGKNIILGVTGSIAAYKAALLVRLLVKKGANIKVLMTPAAKEFITPLTLSTLSQNTVSIDFFDTKSGDWDSHVELGIWADIMIVAPASANTMAKMAHGICDNLLLTTYLSAKCPVFVAPAMDLDMLAHPATLHNISVLKSFGNSIIEPESGELASGLEGKGRMEEPDKIATVVEQFFCRQSNLANKKIIVTAGPTQENIDPVRYISNHSSGKMGYAIAEELAQRGADVILISGNVHIKTSHSRITTIHVVSANDMYEACNEKYPEADAVVFAAAVSDYRPQTVSPKKIKKDSSEMTLKLIKNKDIAAELAKQKKHQIHVGFALETDNEIENAKNKRIKKSFDFVVLNSLKDSGAGFQKDTNRITIIDKHNNIEKFQLKTKQEVAVDIADKLDLFF